MSRGISCIICYYNSGNKLISVLDALAKAIYSCSQINIELILVNNNSNDNTSTLVENYLKQHHFPEVQHLHESKQGLMNARICGTKKAKYDILSFVDDDNLIPDNWFEFIQNTFSVNSKIGVIGTRVEAQFESQAPFWFNKFSKDFAVGQQCDKSGIVNNKFFLWGAGLSIRKEIIIDWMRAQGKFLLSGRTGKTLLGGEDGEICCIALLSGFELYYNDEIVLKHYMPNSRLSKNNLYKMHNGFGQSWLLLQMYIQLIRHQKEFINYSDFTVLKYRIRSKIYYLRSLFSVKAITRMRFKCKFNFTKGYLQSLDYFKDDLSNLYLDISSTVKSIRNEN